MDMLRLASILALLLWLSRQLACQKNEAPILAHHQDILSKKTQLPEGWSCFHASGTGSGKYSLSLRYDQNDQEQQPEPDYLTVEIQLCPSRIDCRRYFEDNKIKQKKGRKRQFEKIEGLGDYAFHFRDQKNQIFFRRGNAIVAVLAEKEQTSATVLSAWIDQRIQTLIEKKPKL